MSVGNILGRIFPKPDPNLGIGRPPCPFYGFTLGVIGEGRGIMMDTEGNGCPLVGPLHHSPCWMEVSGLEPNWQCCTKFNNEGNRDVLEEYLDSVSIVPKEHWPEGAGSWKGIKLRVWFNAFTARQPT